jgi:dTDP-4-amino-4,6-dideoxygalactose transaminase
MNVNFNTPLVYGTEVSYLEKALENKKLCGDGEFSKKCSLWLEKNVGGAKALLTTSCTHALEMAALLANIEKDDEVIMPSYTFVSTANAFALRGAKIVFVDIRPDTLNINEKLIEAAISSRTKVIVAVHYAGVSCEMDEINDISRRYNLTVVEDAAQAIASTYKGANCGSMSDFGCISFHETKNVTCGEGGAIIVKDNKFAELAVIIRDKGTNRVKFFRGEIDKYSWVNQGSSYLLSELNAAFLLAQLENISDIQFDRMKSWNYYYNGLEKLSRNKKIELPYIPLHCTHNAHMFYIKVKDLYERSELLKHLKFNNIGATFHYVPLHSSEAGRKYAIFHEEDKFTTKESERLIRLPMYFGLKETDLEYVVQKIYEFYNDK